MRKSKDTHKKHFIAMIKKVMTGNKKIKNQKRSKTKEEKIKNIDEYLQNSTNKRK